MLDVVTTRSAVSFAVNHPLAGWNIGERRPPAVLLLVVDRDEETAIVIVEQIAAHKVPVPSSRVETDPNIVEANRSCPRFRQITWHGG